MSAQIIHGPWAQQPDPPRMSMSQFRSHVHRHLSNITAFEGHLQEIDHILTHTSGPLRLPYSDHVSVTLAPLGLHLEAFRNFLEETSQLPLVLSALYCGFLSPIISLDDQVRLLTKLLEELCLAYILRPQETALLYRRVCVSSTTLAQRTKQLPTTMNTLLDQASFYDAQLTAIAQGRYTPIWL